MTKRQVEHLESRWLFAASIVSVEVFPDGVLEITGTSRPDEISVAEHFPGSGIFDVFFADTFQQASAPNGIRIDGGGGNDTLSINVNGPIVPVIMFGGAGNDTLRGSPGIDLLDGGPGRDLIEGGAGNDILRGRAGPDTLRGGDGDDTLDGGASNDTLFGDAGGDDNLLGDNGRNTLDGGDGHDVLYGGPSRDRITGGAGPDWFDTRDADQEPVDLSAEDARIP